MHVERLHVKLTHFCLLQVADVSKKGWDEFSTLFNQKTSLYHDPNRVNHSYSTSAISSTYSNIDEEPSAFKSSYQSASYSSEDAQNGTFNESSISKKTPSGRTSKGGPTESTGLTAGVSREEKTLLSFEDSTKITTKSTNRKKKTLEEDAWASLEN